MPGSPPQYDDDPQPSARKLLADLLADYADGNLGGEVGAIAHGDLTGLGGDDHSLYLKETEVGSLMAGIDSRTTFADKYGPDEGYDLELDEPLADNALHTGLSWLNQDAAVARSHGGSIRVDWGGGGDSSNVHGLMTPLPALVTGDVYMHCWGMAQGTGCYPLGVFLYRAPALVWIGHFVPTATPFQDQFFVSKWSDVDTQGATLAGPVTLYPNGSPHVWFHIEREGADDWNVYANYDGGCEFTIASALAVETQLGGAPTHIGWGITATVGGHAGCEWIRMRNIAV